MTGEGPKARAANIFDVARLAGVSHQTVSRVVNEHPNVRPATRDRVNQAIKQLRYRPNTAARAMVTRRTRNLGLIITGSPDFGPASTVLAFSRAAREARYTVSIANVFDTDPESMRASVELLLGQHIEAIVVVATQVGITAAVAAINVELPLITVDPSARGEVRRVAINQYLGARIATEHLIGEGHRHILHLAGPADSVDASERVRGWRDAMADHGLVAPTPVVGDWSPASGFYFGNQIGADLPPYTAVFAANDQMALGCLHAFRRQGLAVPQDISIVGFDDIPEAEHFFPPLTTIRQDFVRLGRDIMAAVLDELDDRESDRSQVVPELVVRDSVRRLSDHRYFPVPPGVAAKDRRVV